jgi:CRP-like cAMP-binding protein
MNKLDFLAQLPLFQGLNEAELMALATISQEYEFDRGAVIAYQRDVADRLYIVQDGRLFAKTVDQHGRVRDTEAYEEGQYFDARWLFTEYAHPATVRASEDGHMLIIQSRDFLALLDKNKRLLDKLQPRFDEHEEYVSGLPLDAWAETRKVRAKATKQSAAVSLLSDELVEYNSRRSKWYLLIQALGPTLALVILPPIAYVLLSGIAPLAAIIIPALLALAAIVFLLFRVLDWSNDYFVITNKHLVHREFDLRTFRTNTKKIPLGQVQSVEIAKPTFWANVFNIGTARITTAATAGILYFDNIDNPIKVKETLDMLGMRVKALNAGREQAVMRHSLESYFQVEEAYTAVVDEQAAAQRVAPPPREGMWRRFHKRYAWRLEEGNTVTYRKHFFVLFEQIAWPLGILGVTLLLHIILIRVFEFTFMRLLSIFSLLYLIDLGWLIWQTEDWRNDTFQVTDRYVIDIDRKPFGFGESRKQAELGNVQNVNADRPGLIPTIFNFGNVIIETAGATADITFESVPSPSVIQSDIFKRRDAEQQKKQFADGERRRKEYAVLLDVYKQAEEQGRLPRRTPEFHEVIEQSDEELEEDFS